MSRPLHCCFILVLLAASWNGGVSAEEAKKPSGDGAAAAAQPAKGASGTEHDAKAAAGHPQEHQHQAEGVKPGAGAAAAAGKDSHPPAADAGHHTEGAAAPADHAKETADGGDAHHQAQHQGVEEEFEVPHHDYQEDPETMEHEVEHAVHPDHDYDDDFVDEWDHTMEGYLPELLLTFPLPARHDEFFYEDLPAGSAPTLIRGGFFATAQEESSDVEFSIMDPKGNKIYERTKAEGLFHFLATEPGTYVFAVSNHQWMSEKSVMFTVGKGNSTHLQPHHVSSLEERVKSIDKALMDVQAESTYLWMRQKSHMKAIENIHNRVFAFCLVEFLVLLGVSSFQVYYIKGLLSDKRVL